MEPSVNQPKNRFKTKHDNKSTVQHDKMEALKQHKTQKAINMRFLTRLHQERVEAERENACAQAKLSQGWRNEEIKQEDALAREMLKDKYQLIKDTRLRDVIRNSQEMKELQQKLKYAYLHKDMAIQLAEKKALQLRKKSQEKEELQQLIEQEKFLQEHEIQLRIADEQKKLKYKEDLQDQLIDRQKSKEQEFRNVLSERMLVDEALKAIWEEEKRDEELKEIRKQMAKEETERILKSKKLWIEKEKEFLEEQDRKIKEYLEEKQRKEKEIQEENKKKEEFRLLNRVACVNMIQSTEKERLERERINQILMEEDIRQKEKDKIRREMDNKLRAMYEFKEISMKQMECRLRKMEQDKLEEIKLSRQLLEENDKAIQREREELERQRRENIKYGKSLKGIMDQHRLNKLQRMEEEYNQQQRELKDIEKRRLLIDEERVKLLKEHVGNLIGYLPKGVIRKEDLPYLDPEVRKFYGGQADVEIE